MVPSDDWLNAQHYRQSKRECILPKQAQFITNKGRAIKELDSLSYPRLLKLTLNWHGQQPRPYEIIELDL